MILLLGIALLAPPEFYGLGIRYEKLGEWQSGDPGLPEVGGTFPIDSLTRYRIERLTGNAVELNVARYQDASAIVFPAQGKSQLRHDLWQSTADAIKNHSDANALFLSWWDDGQRIQFLTGRQPWLNQPVANAFPNASQKALWEEIGGGFNPDETRIKQFARWLSMDADAALAEMDQALPKGQPVYWLASLDDLARLSEIEALSGVKLPFEARVFPAADNLHSQIAAVQRWADEHGSGSYLVQQLQGGGAMVWRITNEAGEKTLLARLLPFTSSLAKPLERLSLVYQSAWGGYLSVYQWQR
jgi:hydroxylamine oxidation protein HaoB